MKYPNIRLASLAILTTATFQVLAAEPVIVTATRTAQSADETIAPVTVITREDIERSTAGDLHELLSGSAGVDFSANGPYGKTNSLFLRGTNSDHVLTLVDGVKLTSATLGTTQFQFIPLEQIERIEIVRGPRASLYGSDAIGGVIQIFTRKGQAATRYNATVGGGSDNTYEASAGAGGGSETTNWRVQAAYTDTDGINLRDDANPDEDGYDNASVSAGVSHSFTGAVDLDVSFLRAEGTSEFDNPFDPPTTFHEDDYVQQALSAKLGVAVNDRLDLTLRAGQSRDESENFTDGAFFSRFDTTHNQLGAQADYLVGDAHLFTVGADYEDDEVDSSESFDEESRDNIGLFTQWQGDYGRHGVVAGLRNDDNEQFGSETTGSVDYRFDITDTLRFNAGAGTGFKAPSFNELYFPDFGNPDLEPEESESFEIGLSGETGNGRWAARAFHTSVDRLINFDPVTFTPVNIDQATIDGVELEYYASIMDWTLGATLTLLDAEDDATGNVLPRRAEQSLRLSADRRFGRFSVGGEVLAQGRRFDDPQNAVELDGFEVFNAQVGYQLREGLEMVLDLENLFDEDYQTSDGYNEKGRGAYLTLRLNGGG